MFYTVTKQNFTLVTFTLLEGKQELKIKMHRVIEPLFFTNEGMPKQRCFFCHQKYDEDHAHLTVFFWATDDQEE